MTLRRRTDTAQGKFSYPTDNLHFNTEPLPQLHSATPTTYIQPTSFNAMPTANIDYSPFWFPHLFNLVKPRIFCHLHLSLHNSTQFRIFLHLPFKGSLLYQVFQHNLQIPTMPHLLMPCQLPPLYLLSIPI